MDFNFGLVMFSSGCVGMYIIMKVIRNRAGETLKGVPFRKNMEFAPNVAQEKFDAFTRLASISSDPRERDRLMKKAEKEIDNMKVTMVLSMGSYKDL